MTYTVTLNSICKRTPSDHFWVELLEKLNKAQMNDITINIEFILDSLGFDDALWALRALPEEQDNAVRLLICDLVEPALRFTNDLRLAKVLQIARAFARGEATKKELSVAESNAKHAAWDAEASTKSAAKEAAKAAAWIAAQPVGNVTFAAANAAAYAAAHAHSIANGVNFAVAFDAAKTEQKHVFRAWLKGE